MKLSPELLHHKAFVAQLPVNTAPDFISWSLASNKCFSTMSVYQLLEFITNGFGNLGYLLN
jgi:hypothetical protein